MSFDAINLLHRPVAWLSMAMLALFVLAAWRRRALTPLTELGATIGAALLANAFVCGALSNAHDRYGARMAWIATLFVAVAVAQILPAFRLSRSIARTRGMLRTTEPLPVRVAVPSEAPVVRQPPPLD
ncbi:MAG: hypothetical protein IT539_00550 [Bradyrhizobiaceae bacterium]|nr:hypothetical protein [Bradyrhizobiaceae bacterium]